MEFIDRLLIKIEAELSGAEKAIKQLERMLLSVGLSFLFTGMAIKRFFETMLNSMFATFLNVEGETGPVNEMVNEIIAKLEFLKFSFIDAFIETGILDKWVTRLENIVNWFISLDDTTKSNIINIAIWGVIIGGIMMVVGQFGLGLLGLTSLLTFILTPLGVFLTFLAFIGIAIVLLMSKFKSFGDFLKAVFRGIINLLTLSLQAFIDLTIENINFLIHLIQQVLNMLPSGVQTMIGYKGTLDLIKSPDIVGTVSSWERKNLPIANDQPVINVNVEGSVVTENELINLVKKGIENSTMYGIGSPQT